MQEYLNINVIFHYNEKDLSTYYLHINIYFLKYVRYQKINTFIQGGKVPPTNFLFKISFER